MVEILPAVGEFQAEDLPAATVIAWPLPPAINTHSTMRAMLRIVPFGTLRRSPVAAGRDRLRVSRHIRRNATYEPPKTPQQPNAHVSMPREAPDNRLPSLSDTSKRTFWMSYGRPIAKVFLGAWFTFQVLHYGWVKLESMEEKYDKDGE